MRRNTRNTIATTLAFAGLTGVLAMAGSAAVAQPAAEPAPQYRFDPTWPKPMPNKWLMQPVGGIFADKDDLIWVLSRPRDAARKDLLAAQNPPESECCVATPAVIAFNARGTVFADYKTGDFSFSARERWHSKLRQDSLAGSVYADKRLPPAYYTDLTITYDLNKLVDRDLKVSLSIQNLFDFVPKNMGFNSATGIGDSAGWAGGDDPIGRYFTLALKLRL